MLDSLLPIVPVLLLFVLGFVLQKLQFFSSRSIADMKKLVSNLALPALMFQAFSSIEVAARYLVLVVLVFAACGVMVAIGKAVARPVGVSSPYFPLMMGGFEMGMLGYALFLSIYGEQHLGKIALVDLGQVVFVFFVLMALLIRERDGVRSVKTLLRHFIASPVIIAIFCGLVASMVKPHIEAGPVLKSLGQFINILGGLTVPLIAITIGYGISIQRKGLAESLKTIAVRKLISIALVLVLNDLVVDRLLGMDQVYRYAMMLMFLTPPPFVISIYMRQDDKRNMDYVSNTLSLDTVVSVLLIVVMSAVYV